MGQAREVRVKLRFEGEEVSDQRDATWTWRRRRSSTRRRFVRFGGVSRDPCVPRESKDDKKKSEKQ